MKRKIVLLFLFLGLIYFSGCSFPSDRDKPEPADLNIFAAASLKDAMMEIQDAFKLKNSDITLSFSFSSSESLVDEIENGEPADFFISASQKQMNALEEKDLIDVSTRKNFVTNPLVLISSKDSTLTSIEDLTSEDITQVAIGDPSSVPAGQYAQEALNNMGIYSQIEGKIVYGKDVEQILEYVENGDVQAGVVYKSDAMRDDQIKIITEFPFGSYNIVTYPMAEIKGSPYPEQVKIFEDFLSSAQVQDIMNKFGFSIPVTTSTD